MPRRIYWLIIPLAIIIVSLGWLQFNQSQSDEKLLQPTATLKLNHHSFDAAIASTNQQQATGLGGITKLDDSQAMYFPYQQASGVGFWMKDMLIPIDIIWIKDSHIVGINANVQPPKPNTPDNQLTVYNSPVDQLDGVVEIQANRSHQLGLAVGQPVTLPQ